jgi:hypothetical protein
MLATLTLYIPPRVRLRHAGITELHRLLTQHLDGTAVLEVEERDAVAWLLQQRAANHTDATTGDAP